MATTGMITTTSMATITRTRTDQTNPGPVGGPAE